MKEREVDNIGNGILKYAEQLQASMQSIRCEMLEYALQLLEASGDDFMSLKPEGKNSDQYWKLAIWNVMVKVGTGDTQALNFIMNLGISQEVIELTANLDDLEQ